MNKFKTLMAAMLIATSVAACNGDEPKATNVVVVDDRGDNADATAAQMNADKDNVEQAAK